MNKIIGVIGGGPAGMSCALWLKYLDFSPIIIDKSEHLGGLQRLSNFENVWYLGLSGKTGYEVAEQFRQHIEAENLSMLLGSKLKRIIKVGDDFKISTETNEITARCLVIATGQRIKEYEGIKSIEGSHHLLSSQHVCFNPGATPSLAPLLEGQVVGVVGGSDNGLVTAIRLANTAKHIHLFVRSELRGFALYQKAILEQIEAGKITLHRRATIHRFEVRGDKIIIVFTDEKNQHKDVLFDYVCFRIGFTPNVEDIVRLFEEGAVGSLKLSQAGYIATDQFLRTSVSGIYAAGDVTNPRDGCVATAVAHGAIAARSLEEDLQCGG